MAEGNGDALDQALNEAALARERAGEEMEAFMREFSSGARWGERIRHAALLALVFCWPTALLVPMVAHVLWRVALASWGWGG